MFPTSDTPRIFYLPPGVDFPREVIGGVAQRLADAPPEAWARTHLVANSGRMITRLRDVLEAGPARLLPRMALVTDHHALPGGAVLPRAEALHPLRRQLDLTRLILEAEGFGSPTTAFGLAATLAELLAEMDEEGVTLRNLEGVDVAQHSRHWQRALTLARIASDYVSGDSTGASPRATARALAEIWAAVPPSHPVLAVGSTGSRGVTEILLDAIARLPQGAVILPGFDPNTPQSVWRVLRERQAEDHPQYRYAALLERCGIAPEDVPPWTDTPPPDTARNRIISLALRPAPVTHQWLQEGPNLPSLIDGTAGLTLLEARDQRQEANAIALRLRQAAEEGEAAALISPDRVLTRRVTAALDRWGIVPDDSAGVPLALTPPGRFLRQLADLLSRGIAADTLIAALKHPLVASVEGARGPHLLMTRALEDHLRRRGPPFPTPGDVADWAQEDPTRGPWAAWLRSILADPATAELPSAFARIRRLAEQLAQGPEGNGSGALWAEAAGRAADALLRDLTETTLAEDAATLVDPAVILARALADVPMTVQNVTHPNIMIWGTLEARAQGAELVILGGLNEESWPQAGKQDPWLNRDMRRQARLRSPDRPLGLAAHDFQQAVGAREVWITRATKSDDAETVPSRWLNRMMTLLEGLRAQDGADALDAMRARGQTWRAQADRLDLAPRSAPAPRPSPAPPVALRPKRLSVTAIKTLIRDPYAIYARHVLRLRPLEPLVGGPDALLRGTVLHGVMEAILAAGLPEDRDAAIAAIAATTDRFLARHVPWVAARVMWKARMMRVAPWFVETEAARQAARAGGRLEVTGAVSLPTLDFTLTCTADRIDITPRGTARIYDYKTGKPPSASQQRSFDKQLLLEAAMAERSGFEDFGEVRVDHAAYIGLGATPEIVAAPLAEGDIWAEFQALMATVLSAEHGYTARRAMKLSADASDYDLLSRYGEWSTADAPTRVIL